MAKKQKAPQVDPQPAINQQLKSQREALAFQEKYTPLATDTNLGVFGGTKQTYDPTTRRVTSTATYNPLIEQGLTESLEQGVNFEDLLAQEQSRIADIYQKPQEKETQKTVENLFGELGASGRYSTRGSDVVAKTIAKANEDRARVSYELGQQAENNLFNRIVNKFNLFYKPTEQITGYTNPALQTQTAVGAGQGGANVISQTGRGIADTMNSAQQTNAQLRMRQSSSPSIWQTLAGAAANTIGNIAIKRFAGGGA